MFPLGYLGSMEANGREPKTGLGRVFNFKIGQFASVHNTHAADLELKTRTRSCPVNLGCPWSVCTNHGIVQSIN
jgi:hypothetical protein